MNLLKPPCDEGAIAAQKADAPSTKERGRWILAATILGSSMVFIDGTVVNVALPALQKSQRDRGRCAVGGGVVCAVFWPRCCCSVESLGDHFGRRRIYATGVVLFALASVWCGLARALTN